MIAKVKSYGLIGITGYKVEVEIDINNGLPSYDVVGLADTAIKESKERVKSAIKNTPFFYIPYQRINEGGLLRCYKVKKIFIEGIGVKKNIVVGVVNEKLKFNKVEVLLNYLLMEG